MPRPAAPQSVPEELADALKRVEEGKFDDAKVREMLSTPVHVRGRVIALRSTGGLSFLKLRDRTGEMQVLLNEAVMGASYTYLENVDIGESIL